MATEIKTFSNFNGNLLEEHNPQDHRFYKANIIVKNKDKYLCAKLTKYPQSVNEVVDIKGVLVRSKISHATIYKPSTTLESLFENLKEVLKNPYLKLVDIY